MPRELEIPAELAAALDGDPGAREAFERESHNTKKQHVFAADGAKTVETRQRRLAKILDELRAQRPQQRFVREGVVEGVAESQLGCCADRLSS